MKSVILWLSILLSASTSAFAANYAVYISIEDGIGITQANREAITQLLQQGLPEHHILVISTTSMPDGAFVEKAHSRIVEKIKETASQLKPGDQVTHLIVDAHGETIQQGNTFVTRMRGLGEIQPQEVGEGFKEILQPLKPFSSASLNVVLNSCNTMCGPENQAIKRAQTLLEFMNAPSGSIYGAITTETDLVRAQPQFLTLRGLVPSKQALAIMFAAAATLTAVTMNDQFVFLPYILNTLKTFAWLLPSVDAGSRLLVPIANNKEWINQGRLFRFHEGTLQSSEIVAKTKNLQKVYGLKNAVKSCKAFLSF